MVKATLDALLSLRLREDIYQGRGLEIKKVQRRQPGSARRQLRSPSNRLIFYAITRS